MKSRIIAPTLNLVIPGWGYAYTGAFIQGLYWQAILYICVALTSWTRLILHPIGLVLLASTILGVHIYVATRSYILFKNRKVNRPLNFKIALLIPTIPILTATLIFLNKSSLLGFDIHKINSSSMEPTLLPGDYIVSDSWIYKKRPPTINDIVLFQLNEKNTNIFVKRIGPAPLHLNPKLNDIYLLGDNSKNSIDSRYFGLININSIRGKVIYIYYAKDKKRIFYPL